MLELMPFVLFAFVASITPGPTNILILSHSIRHGLASALPLVLGGCLGAAAIVLAVGIGVGDALLKHPHLQSGMQWAGIGWLSYLSWQIARSPVEIHTDTGPARQMGFATTAGLQLINPKTWVMAVAVISVFTQPGSAQSKQIAVLSLTFLIVSIPCLTAWALLGRGITGLLHDPRHVRLFNRLLAALLLLSAWASVW
jgi:threonine/homoserine/homoserine lactone efflux protein